MEDINLQTLLFIAKIVYRVVFATYHKAFDFIG